MDEPHDNRKKTSSYRPGFPLLLFPIPITFLEVSTSSVLATMTPWNMLSPMQSTDSGQSLARLLVEHVRVGLHRFDRCVHVYM